MIYLDNSATTYRKPSEVYYAMSRQYANPGRGGHTLSSAAGDVVFECRERLAHFFGADKPENIVFASNTTHALNTAIKGLINPFDHVVISGMEHNSVVRPLVSVGADYTIVTPDSEGRILPSEVEKALMPRTKLVVITHASNVTGTVNDIKAIGKIAKEHNALFLVDSAQTAGVIPIDVTADNVDMLAFAGHKLLYGPPGTGGLYVRDGVRLKTLIEGGTGSMSEDLVQPEFLPDRFESGTLNVSGIAGLNEGVKFLQRVGSGEVLRREYMLTRMLVEGLMNIPRVKLYGVKGAQGRLGVAGFNIDELDSVMLSGVLDKDYGIISRAGLHCSALAHRFLGTLDTGVVRFSISYFTKPREIERAIDAVYKLAK